MSDYRREERWVPVSEMGNRWEPRSREDAEAAMREYPVGGKWLTGEEWDGMERIVREVRYVTEWTEEPATDPRLTAAPTDQPEEVRCGGEGRSGARDGLTCLAAVPPGWPHVPCVRPFKHEGEHSATPKWVDLFGIDPDYTGGQDVNEWLDESRGDA